MSDGFSQKHANSFHNSFIPFECSSTLKDVKYFPVESVTGIRMILSEKSRFVLVGMNSLGVFDTHAKEQCQYKTFANSPVVIVNNTISFLSPESRNELCQVTFAGKIVLDRLFVPYFDDRCNIQLFDIVNENLVAVTYPMEPQGKTMQMIFSLPLKDNAVFSWFTSNEFAPLMTEPVYNPFNKHIVIAQATGQVMVYHLDSKELTSKSTPIFTFPIPEKLNDVQLSTDGNGKFFWCGASENVTTIVETDEKGTVIHTNFIPMDFQRNAIALLPPIISQKHVCLLLPNQLICIENGSVLWKRDLPLHLNKFAASCKNGIILMNGKNIEFIAFDGTTIAKRELHDEAVAQPVLLANGTIVIAHKQAVSLVY